MKASGINAFFGKHQVLFGAQAEFVQGQWTCIVGPNGAGKTSLLKVMAGLMPAKGEVLVQDQSLHLMSAKQRARAMAWLGQQEGVSNDLSVQDVVMLGRLPYQSWWSGPSDEDRAVVNHLLQSYGVHPWRFRSLSTLSSGERQRVLLLRALAVQAPVLLMDEPIANVDAPHQADWLATVQHLTSEGTTVVSVLHDLNLALRADQVLVMQSGRVVMQASPQDPRLHACLQDVFDHRLSFHQLDSQWVALTR
jgi:iron complex transport system ATP-binding protein